MEPVAVFSGLASGIDTSSLVDQLVALERRPIDLLSQKRRDLGAVSNRLSGIRGDLDTLKNLAEELDTRSEVLFSSASSSDEDAVSVSAEGAASLGSFDVEVTSLAAAERTYSDAFADKDTSGLFGTGTLTIQVGAEDSVDIDVTSSDTLETVVSKINASGANVTSGILFDGTNYRLQVSGNDTGAENAISFTETGTSLGLDDVGNQVQAAADAVFSVDGFAMTRSSNLVADAVPGVTLELNAATTGPVTVAISRDADALEAKLQEFVDTYNDVMTTINGEFAFAGVARIGDSLSGDSTLRNLQSRLRNEVGRVVEGLDDPYNRLSGVGITSTSAGTLELDSTALSEALADDPEAVAKLFMDDPATGVTGVMANFSAAVEEYTQSGTGLLAIKIDGIGDQQDDIDDQIARMEQRVESFEERMRAQFAAMEQIVGNLQGQGAQLNAILGTLG